MNKILNKEELINNISQELDFQKSAVKEIVNKFIETITSEVKMGTKVSISGLGTFEKVLKKARQGVNPSTGAKISIAARQAPKFKVAKGFKDLVAEVMASS